ncbi:MAG: bifunctional alpha,alpha-trehalose-phosphate synthase (UDP-forming)/trehalose-phosphatase, partial [Mangrovibacterium sp.]|nr:bifunctional alpha,alpha-trehalose-phosphate synthase (UDP-forming)/trehalose-phosphatase [Mangrovibacterium sp.]
MMNKIFIASNRLPVSIQKDEGEFILTPSVGGLATGMSSIYKEYGGQWIGWSGVASDDLTGEEIRMIDRKLVGEQCVAIHLTREEINL